MVTPGVQATRVAPLIGNARSVLRNRAKTGRRRCNDSPLPAPLSLSRCNLVSRNGCMRYLSPFPDCSPPIFSLSLSRILLFNVGENFCCLTVWWFFQSSSRSQFLKYKTFASIRDEESRFSFFFSKEMFETESRVIEERALFAPRANIRYQERRITLCGRSVVTDAYFARNHSCRLSDHCDVFSTYPPAQSRLLP